MTTKWLTEGELNTAGWCWSFTSKGDDLTASNIEFAEVVSKTCKSFAGYFRPDLIEVHYRPTRNTTREEAEGLKKPEFLGRIGTNSRGSTTGFRPEDVKERILGVISRDRENALILDVYLYGLTRLFDINENGEVAEMWERRDGLPDDSRGTLQFEFQNPYPHDFNVRIWTYSEIFIPQILNIDNKDIAKRNAKALEEQFKRFEREVDAKHVYAESEYYDNLVWKYGFR